MYDLSQEIEVYKASLPYMVAAKDKANSLQMNDHGPLHAQRVHSSARLLGALFELSSHEYSLLLASALLHDIGMVKDRKTHHIISYDIVKKLSVDGLLPFDEYESEIVATLCKWHRKEYDRELIDVETGVRVGLLASLLRIADSMDLDYRRSTDYESRNQIVEDFYSEQKQHHLSVLNILALRVVVSPVERKFEVFLDQFSHAKEQVERLIDEMLGTQLSWPVQIVPVHKVLPTYENSGVVEKKKAIIFAYCNAHGLISAAISKKQFEALGFETEVVCNFEKTVSPWSFWKDHIPNYDFSSYRIVSIIDLHIPEDFLAGVLGIVRSNLHCKWSYSSPLAVSGLDIQKMLAAGMTVSLCDERALFAGSALDQDSLFWLKVAGLSNFDDHIMFTMAGRDEYLVSRGLRYAIDRGIVGNRDSNYFNGLVSHVLNDDRDVFFKSSDGLDEHIASVDIEFKKIGRVLVLSESTVLGRSIYDFIYRAIDRVGVLPYAGEFSSPYAVYPQKNRHGIRVLFLSRFNDLNKAFPVKYFTSYLDSQVGSTSTIWQTFPTEKDAICAINATIDRINSHFGECCSDKVEQLNFVEQGPR